MSSLRRFSRFEESTIIKIMTAFLKFVLKADDVCITVDRDNDWFDEEPIPNENRKSQA